MKIVNGILFTESGFYRGTLQVENGGIVSIAAPSPEDGREGCVDAAGGYVLPGLLDIHIQANLQCVSFHRILSCLSFSVKFHSPGICGSQDFAGNTFQNILIFYLKPYNSLIISSCKSQHL